MIDVVLSASVDGRPKWFGADGRVLVSVYVSEVESTLARIDFEIVEGQGDEFGRIVFRFANEQHVPLIEIGGRRHWPPVLLEGENGGGSK